MTMNPPPRLHQIVEALICASEEAMDSERVANAIHLAVGHAKSTLEEEEALPPEWEALLSTDADAVDLAIAELNTRYEHEGHALAIVKRTRGWKLMTRPEYADFPAALFPERRSQRLSAPALETLSIIAYRQPVTKAEMESVRGVAVDGMVQKLLDLEFIKIGGRAELPGRPLLYVTTEKFLEHFNLRGLSELPNIQELARVRLPTAEEIHQPELLPDAPPPEEPTEMPLEQNQDTQAQPAAEEETAAAPPAE